MRVDAFSEPGDLPDDATGREVSMYAGWTRTALLLETLAEDHFEDEAEFHAWIARQQSINLRPGAAKEGA